MKKNSIMVLATTLLLLCSCSVPQVAYFNDMNNGQAVKVEEMAAVRLQPEDKVSIVVKSKDPQLSELFNLPIIASRIGYGQSSNSYYSQGASLYTIDSRGEIDFPVIGRLKIAGMSREEAATYVKQQLMAKNMVQDPVVTVEYANLGFNVLGEVSRPGRYMFDRDHMTLLDALSMAGDLTIQGRRENVMVIREGENGERTSYMVDLRSARSVYESPAYYIRQNDVIYVEPNNVRARQSTVNGNTVRSASFWISLASLMTSIAVLITRF